MSKDKIVNGLIALISIIMLVLLLLFQYRLSIVFICISVYLFILGIFVLIKKSVTGLVILSIGICGIITYLIYYNGVLPYYDCYTFMFALTLGLILSITLIKSIIDRVIICRLYTIKVKGRVIDLVLNPNTKKEYYKPVIEYELNKRKYKVNYPFYKKRFIPKIGDEISILIDPSDNYETYFLPEFKEDFLNISTSLFLIIGCIIILITLF